MNQTDWQMESWLDDAQIRGIEYAVYWNNEEVEKEKAWDVLDGNFSKMEAHLAQTGLVSDLTKCVELLKKKFHRELKGVGIDLAAGTLWAAPYLFKIGKLDRLYCLEYSKHRLFKIGPKVLEHANIPKEKIVLVLGSFYDLRLQDHSVDFVFLSQAFHHADDPDRLLAEIRRILKPNGVVIIIGEHFFPYSKIFLKHVLKFFITKLVPQSVQKKIFGKIFEENRLIFSPHELMPPDPVSGDHYYTNRQYHSLFLKHGFEMRQVKDHFSQFQSFLLVPGK